MRHILWRVLAALTILAGTQHPAKAQWLTQTVTVTNGWTAAYLFVDASSQPILPTTPGQFIAPNNPIDQIWLWKVPASTAQYISTPESPLSSSGQWISWGRTNSQNSLTALIPNAAYLIHSTASSNFNWQIQGQPVPPNYVWDLTGLNFIGFETPVTNPPSFQNFFAQDPAVENFLQVYEYIGGEFNTTPANPMPLISPLWASTPVKRGQAYWMAATNVNNTYFGPFTISLPNPSGLNYGSSGGQLTFHLLNVTASPLTISVKLLPSETPPAGQTPIVGPPPLLLEGAENVTNLTYGYTSFGAASSAGATNVLSWTLPPNGQSGSDVAVVLGVNRFAMTNSPGSLYAGILQFSDSLGFSAVDVPVTATAASNSGLWVGQASVGQVSYDLKTYATNANGSLVISAVTNQVVTTNYAALGATANLFVSQSITTNTEILYTIATNIVVNTYTTYTYQFATNGAVVSTNLAVQYAGISSVITNTEVTGYYYTNNGALLVWQTANQVYGPFLSAYPVSTNITFVTNLTATVSSNGVLQTVATTEIDYYTVTNEVVTNGIFMGPVTNFFVSTYSATNLTTSFGPVFNLVATNVMTSSWSVTNYPTGGSTVTTNAPVVTVNPPVTNFIPALRPLLLATNGANLITVNVQTNYFFITSELDPFYSFNNAIISNNYAIIGGITNLVGSNSTPGAIGSFPGQPSDVTYNYSFLSLAINTNALYTLATNELVSSVSNYVVTAHNTSLDSVVTAYPLRLIVFQGSNGVCSLLQRVYYGISQGTNLVVSTTQNTLDAAHLNVARRITATALPWTAANHPFYFNGGILAQGATLTTTVTDSYDDQAANPFLHTYHPDHNNLDFTYNPPHELPAGSQSYNITRVITLSVTPNGNDFLSLTTANSVLSGNYNETITLGGLGGATKSYQTAGTFVLKQISTIPVLSTQ